MTYSICETLAAIKWHIRPLTALGQKFSGGAAIKWHIRPLTALGQKFSGGADTPTLCGLKAVWDINAPVIPQVLVTERFCAGCRKAYEETTK